MNSSSSETGNTPPPAAAAAPPPSLNRCNLPPWIIGGCDFQGDPLPIEIEGVRRADRRLFERLHAITDPDERGRVFHEYVSVKFRLHEWSEHQDLARSSLRSSYAFFLRNWGNDSNGRAGALLKSWVENRFGLPATFHRGRLASDAAAREQYARDRMLGAAQTVGAMMQLDLLYTYCQDELRRRFPGERWRRLYRGTHDPDEYLTRDEAPRADGTVVVLLNNLSSFTSDPEIAWEFGSSVWEVSVPLVKIVFFSGLLPRQLLGGEAEHLVLGGEYRVRRRIW